jgi:hypothetical protein
MSNVKYVIPQRGDWEGLYINGELEIEGHRLANEIWYKLGQKFPNLDFYEIDHIIITNDYADEGYDKYFKDIPKNAIIQK